MSLYWFRHTFNYLLEGLDVSDRVINRLFGKLPEGSLRSYTHKNIKQMKGAIDQLPSIDPKSFGSKLVQNEKTNVITL